jgi:hypothetical protein
VVGADAANHRPAAPVGHALPARLAAQLGQDRADEDRPYRPAQLAVEGHEEAQPDGRRQHPLPHRHGRQHAVH